MIPEVIPLLSAGVFVVQRWEEAKELLVLLCPSAVLVPHPWDVLGIPGLSPRLGAVTRTARRDWREAVPGQAGKRHCCRFSGASQQANPVAGSGVLSATARSENSSC